MLIRFFWLAGWCLLSIWAIGQPTPAIPPTRALAGVGKVWGLLKYYHPQVAKGQPDWDARLVRLLAELPPNPSRDELSSKMLAWTDLLGPVDPCADCPPPDSTVFTRNLDWNWLADSTLFTERLRRQLARIAAGRPSKSNSYVHWNPLRNRLEFTEADYPGMALPETSYRLLALFRYWNIIHYFHPTKYAFRQNWDGVLTEAIPRFWQATDTLGYQRALVYLICAIEDSHAGLIVPKAYQRPPADTTRYPPFDYRLVADTLLVTGLLNDSLGQLDDVRRGDRIVRVDGQSVGQRLDEQSREVSGSNRATRRLRILPTLLMGSAPMCRVELIRDGQRIEKMVHRYPFARFNYRPAVRSGSPLVEVPANIGYVDLGQLEVQQVKRVMEQHWDKTGIIFDVRSYPKGTFQRLCDYLNAQPTEFARYTRPDLSAPGTFRISAVQRVGRPKARPYAGKVAILCNAQTQSAGESTCMALRTAPRSRIIGSQTAGANGDVSYVTFPGGYQTLFTGTGVYTPAMQLIQGPGVPIDMEASQSAEDVLRGTDRALQTAIKWISQ